MPKHYKKDKTHRINSVVNEEMYNNLKAISEDTGVEMSGLIRMFLARGMRPWILDLERKNKKEI